MTTIIPPALKATIASIIGIKKDPTKGRYWVVYCPQCRQLVSAENLSCSICHGTRLIDPDDEVTLQFSGFELECTNCSAQQTGLGMTPCTCGHREFRIIRPSYVLTQQVVRVP